MEKFFENFDWILVMVVLFLIGFGLLTQYSIGHVPEKLKHTTLDEGNPFFQRQLIWSMIGIVVMILAVVIPFSYYEYAATFLYVAGLILLVVVLFAQPHKGSHRWIHLGSVGFQPSEFMKIAVVFMLAKFLSTKNSDPNDIRVLALSVLIVLIPALLIIRQPDLGTALIFPALLFPVLYWRGIREGALILFLTPLISAFLTIYSEWTLESGSYPFPLLIFLVFILILAYRRRDKIIQSITLVGLNLGVILLVPKLWNRLQPYQQSRILAFLRPESDILGTGWQVYQSKIAIGSGGFMGKGLFHGTQKLLAFLPERHSDFVYSVLSEELGFVGAVFIIALFMIMILRGIQIAGRMKNRFASLVAIGICSYFTFHVVINIGMATGFAPVTGLPLPFMSYGGTSMLVACFMTGVLLNFGLRFYEY